MSSTRRFIASLAATFLTIAGAVAAPTVSTLTPAAGASVTSLTQISVTFSEAVTGVKAGDLLVSPGLRHRSLCIHLHATASFAINCRGTGCHAIFSR